MNMITALQHGLELVAALIVILEIRGASKIKLKKVNKKRTLQLEG
jgi:hypothetical protein